MAESTKRIAFGSAERLSANLNEVFRDYPQLLGKCRCIRCKVGALPALPYHKQRGYTSVPQNLANLQFATGPVCAQNPDSQPSKVYLSL